jgi:flavodoxin
MQLCGRLPQRHSTFVSRTKDREDNEMNALVNYVSVHHGNTAKVAKVIATVLDADLLNVQQADPSILEQYDLVGFGSGIYFGKHHRILLGFVDTLPLLRNKPAFIFSTSGLRRMPLIHDFSKPLKERLQRNGLNIVAEFSCRGFDTSWAALLIGGINNGRPNAIDLEQAESFARVLRDQFG